MGRVLVVDDEQDHSTTIRGILERGNVPVTVATSVEEAFGAAATSRFEVAIVDLRLPGRDGLAVMHGLRRLQPWIEVVILTAYPTPGSCRAALTEGAAAYLEKPFSPEALRALIGALISKVESAQNQRRENGGGDDAAADDPTLPDESPR